jgi:hypothetical protein
MDNWPEVTITSLTAHIFLNRLHTFPVRRSSRVYSFHLSLEKICVSEIFVDIQAKRNVTSVPFPFQNSVVKEILNITKFCKINQNPSCLFHIATETVNTLIFYALAYWLIWRVVIDEHRIYGN